MGELNAQIGLSPKPSHKETTSKTPATTSDLTSAGTKKRSTPDQNDEGPVAEPEAKRRCIEENRIQALPAEDIIMAIPDTRPAFNDEPSHLLRRATALVLEHVGFDGATKEALECFCSEAESCVCPCPYILARTRSVLSIHRCNQILVFCDKVYAFCTPLITYAS